MICGLLETSSVVDLERVHSRARVATTRSQCRQTNREGRAGLPALQLAVLTVRLRLSRWKVTDCPTTESLVNFVDTVGWLFCSVTDACTVEPRGDGSVAGVHTTARRPHEAEPAELVRAATGARSTAYNARGWMIRRCMRDRKPAGLRDVAQATGPERGADGRRVGPKSLQLRKGASRSSSSGTAGAKRLRPLAPVQLERVVRCGGFAGNWKQTPATMEW